MIGGQRAPSPPCGGWGGRGGWGHAAGEPENPHEEALEASMVQAFVAECVDFCSFYHGKIAKMTNQT